MRAVLLCCLVILALASATPGRSQPLAAAPAATESYAISLVRDIATGDFGGMDSSNSYAAIGDIVYFPAAAAFLGQELWRSDGTEAGTTMVKNIAPDVVSSNPEQLTAIGSTLYFTTYRNLFGNDGRDLWRSDGTEAGTVRLVEAKLGFLPDVARVLELFPAGTKLFYTATGVSGGARSLWVTDGAPGGETLLKSNVARDPLDAIDLNGVLIFAVSNDANDAIEIWRSNGTDTGTVLVTTVQANPNAGLSFTQFGAALFFFVVTNTTYEVWKTDGQVGGVTQRVATINSATGGAVASGTRFVPFNGALYFIANNGVNGYELWRSDGTETGTFMVKDVYSGSESGAAYPLVASSDRLFFIGADGATGYELWQSNGQASGTSLVADLSPGTDNSFIGWITAPAGLPALVSINIAGSGYQLWQSDGSAAGTMALPGFGPADFASRPFIPIVVGNNVFFSAADATNGRELWVAKGTPPQKTVHLPLITR